MGMTISCPFATVDDLNSRFESFSGGLLTCGSDDMKTAYRSLSFNGRESEPAFSNSCGSRKMIVEECLSFKGRESEPKISLRAPMLNNGEMVRAPGQDSKEVPGKSPSAQNLSWACSPRPDEKSGDHRHHQAAVKLQKTYKSFRIRRQLADCAVLVEQRWWKLLDFAELKRSSVSFFDIGKPETAVSRWSRARTRAAKVGKGLSKDEKARKLAFQHWLEAIDPRHRYGHNLQFYYARWLVCESRQPFFYWLDVGEGREVNLEKCPRSKLQQQCIKYLGPMERQEYEVKIDNGKFIYKQSGKLLDTRGGPEGTKWIFVLSVSKNLYVGKKKKGTFQHSSFLAGGATLSAGRLVVEDGTLKAVWPHSGHYRPTEENFKELLSFLEQNKVDVSVVQKYASDEDERETGFTRTSLSEPNFSWILDGIYWEKTDSRRNYGENAEILRPPPSSCSRRLPPKIASIEIPKRENMQELFKNEEQEPRPSRRSVRSPVDGYETAEEYLTDIAFSISKRNLFDYQEEEYEEPIPKEKIYKRIFSHKGMNSYQLAHQLSCKWSTGAGPRIGCVRDYPSELQFRALEEVSLSPRSAFQSSHKHSRPSPRVSTPSNLCRETSLGRSPFASEPMMLSQMLTP